MKLPTFPVEGGCQCRAVRYQITAPPLGVYNCHCKDCQRSSGGAHTVSMPTRREHVVLLRGELVAFDKAADSGLARPRRKVDVIFTPENGDGPGVRFRKGKR